MVNSNKVVFVVVACLLATCFVSAEEDQKHEEVFVGSEKTFKLTGTAPFVGHYKLNIKQSDIPKDQEKWYLFTMAEPKEKSAQLFGSPYKILMKSNEKLIKECQIVEESDSCFLKNNQFDYKKDKINVEVHCEEACQFQFVTEIDYAYPLKMNKPFKLNFENTAYSKVFTLSTEGEQFYELRIMLEPNGFIKYGQPVVLLANYGSEVPSQKKHDFKGMQIWDDGQGIFIRKSEMKERTLTVLVQGPEKNVLNLIAEGWQKEEKLELHEYWPEFDWLKAGETRQAAFTLDVTNLTCRIKVVVFSGFLELPELFKVQEGISEKLTPLKFSVPNQKYGEFEFRLSKQVIQSQNLKKVVIKVTARRETTYIINYGREEAAISTILPYVSQSSLMQPKQIDQYFLKVEELIESTKDKKSSNIQIIMGTVSGNIKPSFYRCNYQYKVGGPENIKNCEINQTNKKDFTEVIPTKSQNRGGERRFWFQIQWLDYVKKSDKDKSQVVFQMVILVQNANGDKSSSYQIQYKNKDRIYLLKEGQLTKDRVFINEKRHYKLSVRDSDATEIRIHCTKISGEAFFIGSFIDPRTNKQREKVLPLYSVITFKINPDQKVNEVFLEVEGVDNAYYSITTQVIRKSEQNPTKSTTGYNELIVRQEIPYQFLIAPLSSIVLQLHPTSKRANINLKATSAVKVCMTQNLSAPPFAPNCQISNDFFLEMNEEIFFDKGLVGNIGIKNTNTDKNVSIKIRISSRAEKKNKTDGEPEQKREQKCELGPMNQVMFERIGSKGKDANGESIHCLEFNLHKNEEVQLIVDVRGDHFYEKGSITANINDQETVKILSPSHIFTKQEVESSCLSSKKKEKEAFCYLRVKIEGIQNVRVRVLAQYTSDAIRLIDGIGHPVHSLMSKLEPKHFYIGIHNTQNITIFLENKVGQYKLYASIMPYSEFSKTFNKSSFPTKQKKDLESSNPFYYLEQIVTVPMEKITQKCPASAGPGVIPNLFGRKWLDCVLVMSVVLDGSAELLKGGKFVIQATQQNRELRNNVPLNGYLQKKSAAFYNYHNDIENGTILITINNQNKNCLDIYFRKGSERATANYNEKSSKAGNSLMYNDAEIGTYSVTIEANQNCPYTIVASSGKNSLRRIKKGTFADINLGIGEQMNLLFENHINETFKILALNKAGEIIISVNPIPKEELSSLLSKDLSKIHDWNWSNKDSVRINNMNAKKTGPNPNFCVNCYYLININAQRQTEASIVIPTPDSELPITADSLIKDLLEKDEVVTYRIFTESSSQFQVYVQYGKIQVTIVESEQEIVSFNKTFEATKAPSLQTFNLTKTESYEFLRYIKIKIRAIQDTYFSFAILSNADPAKRGPGLKYGIPEYIYLDSNKQKCVVGTMSASVDQFLLSFSRMDKTAVEDVEIKVKVNDKEVSTDKEAGNNEMILRVNSMGLDATNKKFDICLKSKIPVSITLIQSSPLNYWPEKENIIVKKQSNWTFGAEGRTIVEINQCKSRAIAEIFSQFNQMKSTSSQVKQRRKSNNIIEFYHYGPVYIKVKSQKSILRWFAVNETSGAGLGYDDYKSSWIRVVKNDDTIQIAADPIRKVNPKECKSKIESVMYNFIAAKEQNQLYNAMNCGKGDFVFHNFLVELKKNQTRGQQIVKSSFNIKTQLIPKFEKLNYFLIGVKAQVTVKTPEGQLETYRFFYPYQQVSRETILYGKPNPITPQTEIIEEKQNEGIILYVGYALVALILITAIYILYIKYCKKCLKKKQRFDESMGREMKYFDLTENH